MARTNQQSREQRRLNALSVLGSMKLFRQDNQRKVRAGQPTFTRALYLIDQREKLTKAMREAAEAARKAQQAQMMESLETV